MAKGKQVLIEMHRQIKMRLKKLKKRKMHKVSGNSDKFVIESNLRLWTSAIMKNTFINDYRHSCHLDGVAFERSDEERKVTLVYGAND